MNEYRHLQITQLKEFTQLIKVNMQSHNKNTNHV
jgi:hypothetical protein